MIDKDSVIPGQIEIGGKYVYGETIEYRMITQEGVSTQALQRFEKWRNKKWDIVVWENTPRDGYKIEKRTDASLWGAPCDRWGVQLPGHPHITVALSEGNLAYLLAHTTITGGVIEGRCLWVQHGTGLTLIPDTCPAYGVARETTILKGMRVSLRDVQPGDVVRLHDGDLVTYLGLFRNLVYSTYDYGRASRGIRKSYYYIKHDDTGVGTLISRSTIDIGDIVRKAKIPLTDEERWKKVYEFMPKRRGSLAGKIQAPPSDIDYEMVFVAPVKFKVEDVDIYIEGDNPLTDISVLGQDPCLVVTLPHGMEGEVGQYAWASILGGPNAHIGEVFGTKIALGALLSGKGLSRVLKALKVPTGNDGKSSHKYLGSKFQNDSLVLDVHKWHRVNVRLPGTPYDTYLRYVQM